MLAYSSPIPSKREIASSWTTTIKAYNKSHMELPTLIGMHIKANDETLILILLNTRSCWNHGYHFYILRSCTIYFSSDINVIHLILYITARKSQSSNLKSFSTNEELLMQSAQTIQAQTKTQAQFKKTI